MEREASALAEMGSLDSTADKNSIYQEACGEKLNQAMSKNVTVVRFSVCVDLSHISETQPENTELSSCAPLWPG